MDVVSDVTFDPLLSWSVVRIDYAINLYTLQVPFYVALAKRAKLLRGYVCAEDKPGSVYVQCNSATLNFYDKLTKCRNSQIGGYITIGCAVMLTIYIG